MTRWLRLTAVVAVLAAGACKGSEGAAPPRTTTTTSPGSAVSFASTAVPATVGAPGSPAPSAAPAAGATTTAAPTGPTLPVDSRLTVEQQLLAIQKKQTPDLTVDNASCPNGQPVGDLGATVGCTVRADGVEIPYTVTVVAIGPASEGGIRSYQFRPARPVVIVTQLVATIREQSAAQLKVAPEALAVDCGPAKIQVLDIGGKIRCTLNDGTTTRTLEAVVTDENGSTKINQV
ncbi:MAG TPA: hypothetical protein VFJ85_18135 [Acidimicrobiales bacterium]|nr:hypothetical protein [Acidimicrobiales bacterium]